jgi:RNA polymerase sigma factor (sigma-70 family)
MHNDKLSGQLEEAHAAAYSWALTCCGGRTEDAEDLLHVVYLSVLDGRAKFGGRSSFRTWLFGVIRLTALAQRRRRWFHRRLQLLWSYERVDVSAAQSEEEQTDPGDLNHRLRKELIALAKRQREVLELVFYHENTIEEAAAIMRVSVGTARTHYARGKSRLAAALDRKMEEEDE